MTILDEGNHEVAIAVSAIEIEVLDELRAVIIRNPPPELAQAGVHDRATWLQYGDQSGYDFFDPVLRGERALPVGRIETWIFAEGDDKVAIRGRLIADEAAPTPAADTAKVPSANDDLLHEIADYIAARSQTNPERPAASLASGLVETPIIEPHPTLAPPMAPARFGNPVRQYHLGVETTAPPIDPNALSPERTWRDYVWMRRSDQPGNALGPGGGYCAARDYDPFHDLSRPFRQWDAE
jgi:hypothetical protein